MEIKNLKFKYQNIEYTIDGEVELYPNNGFNLTKITKINNENRDSIVLRGLIKHDDILNHLNKTKEYA